MGPLRPLGIRKAGLREAGGAPRRAFPVPAPGPRGRPVSRSPCLCAPREPEARWGLGASDARRESRAAGGGRAFQLHRHASGSAVAFAQQILDPQQFLFYLLIYFFILMKN